MRAPWQLWCQASHPASSRAFSGQAGAHLTSSPSARAGRRGGSNALKAALRGLPACDIQRLRGLSCLGTRVAGSLKRILKHNGPGGCHVLCKARPRSAPEPRQLRLRSGRRLQGPRGGRENARQAIGSCWDASVAEQLQVLTAVPAACIAPGVRATRVGSGVRPRPHLCRSRAGAPAPPCSSLGFQWRSRPAPTRAPERLVRVRVYAGGGEGGVWVPACRYGGAGTAGSWGGG